MMADSIQPGNIWKARSLNSGFVEAQLLAELHHNSTSSHLNQLAFSENVWESWVWNSREALHLNNSKWKSWKILPIQVIPQHKINFHLLQAYRDLINGWHQWNQLPQLAASIQHADTGGSFLLLSAMGRLEQAQVKQDSLTSQKNKFLQSISLRQLRLHQNLVALLEDIHPLLVSAMELTDSDQETLDKLSTTLKDINWHNKELSALTGNLQDKPSLIKRILLPHMEINRLLGTVCNYHSVFLKSLLPLSYS